MRIININLKGVNKRQKDIMLFVDYWVHEKKTPTPHSEIIKHMKEKKGSKVFTTANAIKALLKKGYIRRAVMTSNKNKTFYVQLRRV